MYYTCINLLLINICNKVRLTEDMYLHKSVKNNVYPSIHTKKSVAKLKITVNALFLKNVETSHICSSIKWQSLQNKILKGDVLLFTLIKLLNTSTFICFSLYPSLWEWQNCVFLFYSWRLKSPMNIQREKLEIAQTVFATYSF